MTRLICIIGAVVFLALIVSEWPFPLVLAEGIATIAAALWSLRRQFTRGSQ